MFERTEIGRVSPAQAAYRPIDLIVECAPTRDGVRGSELSVGEGVSAQGLQASRLETQRDLRVLTSLGDADEPMPTETPGPRTLAYLEAYQAWQAAKQHEMELQFEAQRFPSYTLGCHGGALPLHLRAPLDVAIRCAREAQDAMLTAYMNLMASEEGTAGLR